MSEFERQCKDLYRIRQTLHELLEDRGIDMTKVNTAIGYSQWCEMVGDYQGKLPSLDIQVNEGKKVYVKFINEFKTNEAKTAYAVIMRMMNMDRAADDIIFVVTDKDAPKLRNDMKALESAFGNLTVFHANELVFNVSRHILVPRHSLVADTEKPAICKEYQVTNELQFPVIERKDPQVRYLGARRSSLVKIERPSIGGLCHTVYRIVI